MADYTVTTTTRQEAVLAVILTRSNAARAAQTPPLPALTLAQYVDARLTDVIKSYVAQLDEEGARAVRDAFLAASPADQTAVKTRLGL